MNISNFIKLRWLRMIAINDLQTEEYDLVIALSEKYREGETAVFTSEEIESLDCVYQRLKKLSDTGRIPRLEDESLE